MPTDRDLICSSCGDKERARRLFDALHDRSRGEPPPCGCGGQRYLKASFPFGLGAGPFACKVLAAFLPEWDDGAGGKVTFYPFLIIAESLDGENKQTAWLPYWHIVTYADGRAMQTKYGQWAPHMDGDILANLVDQARRAGFLA
jgi:hypothetical protein